MGSDHHTCNQEKSWISFETTVYAQVWVIFRLLEKVFAVQREYGHDALGDVRGIDVEIHGVGRKAEPPTFTLFLLLLF